MARIRPILREPEQFRPVRTPDPEKFIEARVNSGIITEIDPADIPHSALQEAKNCVIRFDKTSRRSGSVLFGPPKPNSLPVVKFAAIKDITGIGQTFRFTPTTIHKLEGTWIEVTGPALNGVVADRIQFVNILSKVVFANNGADPIMEIDYNANTYAQLGNANAYRYITGFANRVVAAAHRNVNEVEVAWSAEYPNIDEWSPLTNESAGNSPLVDSPGDLSDFITGVFGLTNIILIPRQRSIWIGTKQPIQSNPFYFANTKIGVGSDSPHSITVVKDGIAWLDRRTRSAYFFSPDQGRFEDIGAPISKTILDGIDDPNSVFGGYDPFFDEYSICIPQVASGYVKVWTFNFKTKAWAYNEILNLTTLGETEIASGGTTIDELIGVIDDLIGTIDELSPSNTSQPILVSGKSNGDLTVPDPTVDTDTGILFETVIRSPVFTLPEHDQNIVMLEFEIELQLSGQIRIEFSKDGGPWIHGRTLGINVVHNPRLLKFRRVIKARRFQWRLVATNGIWDLLKYIVYINPAGTSVSDVVPARGVAVP